MTTEDEEVNSMSQQDGTTPKYMGGFASAVRRLLGPKEGGWSSAHYTDEAAIEQAIRKAYWEGRMDGVDSVLGHPPAPASVEDAEEPLESREGAWERLGLFQVADAPPVVPVLVLTPLDGDPYAWAVRQARSTLGLSLVEATAFVKGVLDD